MPLQKMNTILRYLKREILCSKSCQKLNIFYDIITQNLELAETAIAIYVTYYLNPKPPL